MEKTYVIKWKPRLGAIHHLSKKLFSRDEAEQLAEELNQEHPEFIHEPHNLSLVGIVATESVVAGGNSAVIRNIGFTAVDQLDLPIKEMALA